jgi:Cu-processing system permease protein
MILENVLISIARKEILDNIRNKWIILITSLFTILTLLVSYAGSIFSEGWQDLEGTVAGMSALVQVLISIIGLMLGYAAIVGEIERGTMGPLVSLPAKRLEIIIGKFIGLGTVLTITILLGFGIAGVVIGLNVENVDYGEYLVFIALSILIGLVFLSIGLFLSSVFKKRSTAMGAAIFFWFLLSIIWQFISIAIVLMITSLENIQNLDFPDVYYVFQVINPLQAYSILVSLNVGAGMPSQQDIGSYLGYPDFISNELLIFVIFAWIVVCVLLAIWRFNNRDI